MADLSPSPTEKWSSRIAMIYSQTQRPSTLTFSLSEILSGKRSTMARFEPAAALCRPFAERYFRSLIMALQCDYTYGSLAARSRAEPTYSDPHGA